MEIVWSRVALDGLERARDYVAEHNPVAAERIFSTILSAVRRLGTMPNLGRPGRVNGTRELVVSGTPYVVAYTVRSEAISILAVQHGAQAWPDRL